MNLWEKYIYFGDTAANPIANIKWTWNFLFDVFVWTFLLEGLHVSYSWILDIHMSSFENNTFYEVWWFIRIIGANTVKSKNFAYAMVLSTPLFFIMVSSSEPESSN